MAQLKVGPASCPASGFQLGNQAVNARSSQGCRQLLRLLLCLLLLAAAGLLAPTGHEAAVSATQRQLRLAPPLAFAASAAPPLLLP